MSQPGIASEGGPFLGDSGSSDGQIWLKGCIIALPRLSLEINTWQFNILPFSLPFFPVSLIQGHSPHSPKALPFSPLLSPHLLL